MRVKPPCNDDVSLRLGNCSLNTSNHETFREDLAPYLALTGETFSRLLGKVPPLQKVRMIQQEAPILRRHSDRYSLFKQKYSVVIMGNGKVHAATKGMAGFQTAKVSSTFA